MTLDQRRILAKLQEAKEKSLYVCRHLVNTEEFLRWAREQGFSKTSSPEDLHVTILYSKKPVNWGSFTPDMKQLTVSGGSRSVIPLGDEGAVVLKFSSQALQDRHRVFREGGGHHGYSSYKPHVTITYEAGDLDPSSVKPYRGDLVFGPEKFAVINKEWKPNED